MVKLSGLAIMLFVLITSGCGNNDKQKPGTETTVAPGDTADVTVHKTILFFGNSLTAGYGLDVSEAFPALIQARIDSLKLPYKVVNAGLSGETSAGGKNRIG